MSENTVIINDVSYVFEEMSEKAQMSYQQLVSLRGQLQEAGMKQQQLAAAQKMFEAMLEEELAESPEAT